MTQARLLGGRYQVGELLGYGGMAEVHRGRDLRLGRDVAIKMLRTDLARDDTFQLRFRREAQNAAALNHPAIVAVYDTGEERGSSGETLPYIVMEFVNGRTLKEVLTHEGRLMPRRALEMVAEICAALEFSHRHGIIHRDIKPGNVMLTQAGQIKVMDFGIARALANSGSTMTQTSAVIGTAQYLSPEQARGESVDARSDVYATGCVLYELMCGQPPFIGDSPVSVAYQHVREDARPPSLINRDIPPAVDAVVLKALAKNPLNRYQSAAEMRADVLRAAQGRPVYAEPVMLDPDGGRARPPGQRTAGGRPAPRRRTSPWAVVGLSTLAVLAVVTLIVGVIVSQGPDQKVVPRVNGLDKDLAADQVSAAGLQAKLVSKTDLDCTPNKIVDQDPSAGVKVDSGSTVTLTWCGGLGEVPVPNFLIGQTKESAQQALSDQKFVPQFEDVDSAKPKGTVVATDPAPGKVVAGGSSVKVQISKGNLKVMPDLVGSTEADARTILRSPQYGVVDANIKVKNVTTTDPTKDGMVSSTTPAKDAEFDPATAQITLFVYNYDNPNPSPSASSSPEPSAGT